MGCCIFRYCQLKSNQWPNKSPEPTAVGACRSAVAVHVASRRWLSFLGCYTFMKNTLIIILSGLLICGCSRSSSGPRTTPATESIKGQFIGPAQLVDAGNTTPEAALVSGFWAQASGDYDAVMASTEPKRQNEVKAWLGDRATFRTRSQAMFASFKGLQILARKNIASDRVELKYQFTFQNRPTPHVTKIIEMVKVGGAWRGGHTSGFDASWDDGSQPESQP